MHRPITSHRTAIECILRYLKGTITRDLSIKKNSNLALHEFSDANWADNHDDRRFVGRFAVFLGSDLIFWSSKKQCIVARSSTDYKYKTRENTTAKLMWIRSLLLELGIHIRGPPIIWCDNLTAIRLTGNPVFHARIKHIKTDSHPVSGLRFASSTPLTGFLMCSLRAYLLLQTQSLGSPIVLTGGIRDRIDSWHLLISSFHTNRNTFHEYSTTIFALVQTYFHSRALL